MAVTNQLLSRTQALGAVTAWLRVNAEGRPVDPALHPHIERVVDLLGARDALVGLSAEEAAIVTSFARSYARQALELMDDPFRPNAWSHSDPTVLQAQGMASAVVARLIKEAGLGGEGIRILDVGTGVAGLAMALAGTFPNSTIVGLDPWEPALAIARRNVAEAGLEDRVTLFKGKIEDFDDRDDFDLVWFPSFFIPESVMEAALRKVRSLLRPGGRVVVGVLEGSDDPLAGAINAMVTVRSGGATLGPEEAIQKLTAAGFDEAREADRTWKAPLRLVIGRKDG